MKKLTFISALIYTLFLFGCKGTGTEQEDFIRIDVSKSYPEKEFALQDLFDVEYFVLPTDYVTNASPQYIDDELIIVTDGPSSQTGNIFLIDRKTGECKKVFSHRGQGAGEYVFLRSVIYDKENQELYVNDSMTQCVLVYDMEGNFKRRINHKENSTYFWLFNFDKDYLIAYLEAAGDPGTISFEEAVENSGFMLVSKKDGSTKKIETPYTQFHETILMVNNPKSPTGKSYFAIQNDPLVPCGNDWLLVQPSSDTIYQCSPMHGTKPLIVRSPKIDTMDPEVYLYPGVVTDDYYFLQSIRNEFNVEAGTGYESAELAYDRKENRIYEYKLYNADFKDKQSMKLVWCYPYIPVLINKGGVAYITRMPNQDLIDAYEAGKLQGKLKEVAAGLNEDSNPVIMIMKYKK